MKDGQLFRVKVIKSKDDLPKENGNYFTFRDGVKFTHAFIKGTPDRKYYNDLTFEKFWLKHIDWYLIKNCYQMLMKYNKQSVETVEPGLCPICKTTYLSDRVCLTCTKTLCSPIQINKTAEEILAKKYDITVSDIDAAIRIYIDEHNNPKQ